MYIYVHQKRNAKGKRSSAVNSADATTGRASSELTLLCVKIKIILQKKKKTTYLLRLFFYAGRVAQFLRGYVTRTRPSRNRESHVRTDEFASIAVVPARERERGELVGCDDFIPGIGCTGCAVGLIIERWFPCWDVSVARVVIYLLSLSNYCDAFVLYRTEIIVNINTMIKY